MLQNPAVAFSTYGIAEVNSAMPHTTGDPSMDRTQAAEKQVFQQPAKALPICFLVHGMQAWSVSGPACLFHEPVRRRIGLSRGLFGQPR
jgi:hypothetical protein